MSYHCRCGGCPPRGARSDVRVRIGAAYQPAELTGRDHFLTARWVLFSVTGRRRFFARAAHQPWPLYRAETLWVEDSLFTAAGLAPPEGEPLAHYSPGRRPDRPARELPLTAALARPPSTVSSTWSG